MLRTNWTLSDINALPTGEHDFFDRKSGKLLQDPEFRQTLAKVFSALANSGGGHIVLGVADDRTIDGVRRTVKGRTNTREWLEQVIPNLVEPVPMEFRVHLVSSTTDCLIPDDGVVIVIDVGDSFLAPFQSRYSKLYYYRVAGHSTPAPHFYLESLRNRKHIPVLTSALTDAYVIRALKTQGTVFVQIVVSFDISNEGNITPTQWHLELKCNGKRIAGDGPVIRTNFPGLTVRWNKPQRITNTPVLPGQTVTYKELLGLTFQAESVDDPELSDAIDELFQENDKWSGSVVTDTHIGKEREFDITCLRAALAADEVRHFISNINKDTYAGDIGGGLRLHDFSIDGYDKPDDHVRFRGEVENLSGDGFKQLVIVVAFIDANGKTTGLENCDIGLLPPESRRPWDGWIVAAETWSSTTIEFFFYDKSWLDWEHRRGQAHFAPRTPQNEPVPDGFGSPLGCARLSQSF